MTRVLFILILALTTIASASETAKSHLWQFKKAKKVIYVLGTHHGIGSQHLPLFINEMLDEATRLSFEADYSKIDSVLENPTKNTAGLLKNQISAEAWNHLTKELDGMIEPEALNELNPFMVTAVLQQVRLDESTAQEIEALATKIAETAGTMDMEIYARAVERGAKPGSLETIESQVKILKGLEGNLETTIFETPKETRAKTIKGLKSLLSVTEAYMSGNFAGFKASMNELSAETREAMFAKRNRTWAPQLDSAPSGSFFVVGANHLFGREGLLAMLRDRGYKVTNLHERPMTCSALISGK